MKMIEKMAQAMAVAGSREPDYTGGGPHPSGIWLDPGEAWWTGYENMARDALIAMLEPSDAMVARSPHSTGGYRAMIQAALDEKER